MAAGPDTGRPFFHLTAIPAASAFPSNFAKPIDKIAATSILAKAPSNPYAAGRRIRLPMAARPTIKSVVLANAEELRSLSPSDLYLWARACSFEHGSALSHFHDALLEIGLPIPPPTDSGTPFGNKAEVIAFVRAHAEMLRSLNYVRLHTWCRRQASRGGATYSTIDDILDRTGASYRQKIGQALDTLPKFGAALYTAARRSPDRFAIGDPKGSPIRRAAIQSKNNDSAGDTGLRRCRDKTSSN